MDNRVRRRETHEKILSAAEESFAQLGFDATGVAHICRSAGISKGAFYHHFPSKQSVFLELLERWLSELDGGFAVARRESDSVSDALLSMASQMGDILQEGRDKIHIFFEFLTKASRDPVVWKTTVSYYRRYSDYFAEILETGRAAHTLHPEYSQTAAKILVSLAVGILLQGILDPTGADWEEIIKEGIRLLLRGLESS